MSAIAQVKSYLEAASVASPDDGTLEALLAVSSGDARTAARMIIDDHRAANPAAVTTSNTQTSELRHRRRRDQFEFANDEAEYESLIRQSDRPLHRHRGRQPGGSNAGLSSFWFQALTLPFSLLQSLILGIARLLRLPNLLGGIFPFLRGANSFDEEQEANGPRAAEQLHHEILRLQRSLETPNESASHAGDSAIASSVLERMLTCSYNDALKAAKQDLKILVVLLTSDLRQADEIQSIRSLLSPQVISFLQREDFLLWGASTKRKEGHAVSRQLGIMKTPAVACVALRPTIRSGGLMAASPAASSPRLALVSRVAGSALQTPELLTGHLEDSLARCSSFLEGLRAERVARETERRLMEEQDRAYEEASRRDAERVAQKRAKAAESLRQEQIRRDQERQAAEQLEKKETWKRWVRLQILGEEEPSEDANSTDISVVLPDGRRLRRRFERTTPVEHIYMWIESSSTASEVAADKNIRKPVDYDHTYNFSLFFGYPRRRLSPEEAVGKDVMLCDLDGLCPRANIIVEGVLDTFAKSGDDSSSSDDDDDEEEE